MSSFELTRNLEERGAGIGAFGMTDARLDLPRRGVPDVASASVHYFNTENEIRHFAERVAEVIRDN